MIITYIITQHKYSYKLIHLFYQMFIIIIFVVMLVGRHVLLIKLFIIYIFRLSKIVYVPSIVV